MEINKVMPDEKLPKYCAYPWQQMVIDLTGEVVPCCFWSGYGNKGKPLGNTNIKALDEIWNGSEYRALRLANASGNLRGHPCNQCMAYSWSNGFYPPFEQPSSWRHDSGHCFIIEIPESFLKLVGESQKEVELIEDGNPLPMPNSVHDEIRQSGKGRYSLWGRYVYLSTSDNTDPALNGRSYVLTSPSGFVELPRVILNSPSGSNILKAHEEFVNGVELMTAKPTMISLISTADCNIDCPACSQNVVRLVKVQHRPETVPDVMAHVPYLHQLVWHGGEPYLIKKLRQFIDNFHTGDNPNLTFGFTTNGTMLNAEELAKLHKFPRVNASISIDSFKKETYEKIRKGADYNKVLTNAMHAFSQYEKSRFVFSCGMIICKSNMSELAANVEFALKNGIGLNLSPVVTYPVTEQLDVFEDYEAETANWAEQLDQAEALVSRAKEAGAVAIDRVDPTGMLKGLRTIISKSAAIYRDTTPIAVRITDPSGSLSQMALPGIIVYSNDNHSPLAYCRLRNEQYLYQLKIPKSIAPNQTYWRLLHNLLEPHGEIISANSAYTLIDDCLTISLPPFSAINRPRNVTYASYGETTPQGLFVFQIKDIERGYAAIMKREMPHANSTRRKFIWALKKRKLVWALKKMFHSILKPQK